MAAALQRARNRRLEMLVHPANTLHFQTVLCQCRPSSHFRFKGIQDIQKVSMQAMRIGDLAERTGTSAPTIRYYEQIGLLRQAARQPGGQRV